MERTKAGLLAAVLAGILAVATPAAAQPAWGWHGGGAMRLLRGLNLSDAQKAQVQQLAQATRAQVRPLAQQLRVIHSQINAALLSPGTTGASLQALVQQESQLRTQMESARYALMLQIAQDVLMPAQLSQAATVQQQLASLRAAERQVTGGQ